MIKACFFDMDGTIVSHTNNTIPNSTRLAIQQLKEKGIQVVVATGRHIIELEDMPCKDISFDGYILLNGHLCLNQNKEIIFKHPICKEDTHTLIDLFNKKDFAITLIEKNRFYNNYNDESVVQAQIAISSPMPDVGTYNGEDIYQAIAYLEEEGNICTFFPNCNITRWNRYGLDINAKGGGKIKGIQRYLEANHLLQEEIMAFGDGENDREMLQFARIGVAMGNSDEKTKQCADYITSHIDEDGIYRALKHFQII